MMPRAPDWEFSSLWRFRVATTSSTVSSLPSWNCTPLRILKVHTLASGEALQDSARAATGSPLVGWLSIRVSPQFRPVMKQTCEEIGRASCRERVCQYRVDLGGRRIIKKKKKEK